MNINIGNFTNEKNAFPKNYNWSLELTGALKAPSNIMAPTILVECVNPSSYNYLYILIIDLEALTIPSEP